MRNYSLAGLAYLAPAMPPSSDVLPTKFPQLIDELIVRPASRAKIVRPVETSDPLVEAQYMVGPQGAVVVLINWQEKPVDKLIVRFPGVPVKSVQSLRAAGYFKGALHEQPKGKLTVQTADGVPQVEMDFGVTDYLLVD